jgi:hypothetical protein
MSFQNARYDEGFVNLSLIFRQPLAEEASAESFDAPLSSSLFPAGRFFIQVYALFFLSHLRRSK